MKNKIKEKEMEIENLNGTVSRLNVVIERFVASLEICIL